MFLSCSLQDKEADTSEEESGQENEWEVKNKGAGSKQEKENASENDTSPFFTEEYRKGQDSIGLIAFDILEIFERKSGSVGNKQEEK